MRGGPEHGSFFGSDVGYPVAKGDVGVLGGVTTVGRAFEDDEGETEGVAVSNGCELENRVQRRGERLDIVGRFFVM